MPAMLPAMRTKSSKPFPNGKGSKRSGGEAPLPATHGATRLQPKAIRSVAIVGPGRLGATLAAALHAAGIAVTEIVARSGAEPQRRAQAVAKPLGAKVSAIATAKLHADVVWICVPDERIGTVAEELTTRLWAIRNQSAGNQSAKSATRPATRPMAQNLVVFHSSGLLTSGELAPLARLGLAVASVHPLMTFVKGSSPPLRGVPFATEGTARALRVARQLVRTLGGAPFQIAKEEKPAYHAFCTFACPLLTCLLASAERVGELAGVAPGPAARRILTPILRQTIANYSELGAARGFSGPLVRGDVATVRRHLQVLDELPLERESYLALARAATETLPVGHPIGLIAALREAGESKAKAKPKRLPRRK